MFAGRKAEDDTWLNELPQDSNYDTGHTLADVLNKGSDQTSGEDTENLIEPFPSSRQMAYAKLDEMALDPTIDSALRMHVANALSAKTDTGQLMFIQSTKDADDAIVKYLRDVVGKFLNANAETMAYNATKYGMDTIRPYCEWVRA